MAGPRCRGTRSGGVAKVSEPGEREAPPEVGAGPGVVLLAQLGRCVPAGPLGPARAEQQGYLREGRHLACMPLLTPPWRGTLWAGIRRGLCEGTQGRREGAAGSVPSSRESPYAGIYFGPCGGLDAKSQSK